MAIIRQKSEEKQVAGFWLQGPIRLLIRALNVKIVRLGWIPVMISRWMFARYVDG